MAQDTTFDLVLVGYMIGSYEKRDYNSNPYFDIDAAYDQLGKIGLVTTAKRIVEGDDWFYEKLMDSIKDELDARSLNHSISTSDKIDALRGNTPYDCVQLGYEIAQECAQSDTTVFTLDGRSQMTRLLSAVGLSSVIDIVPENADGEDVLAAIRDVLDANGLNVSISSQENLGPAIKDILALMTPGVFAALPEDAQGSINEAKEHIDNDKLTDAARHLCLAVEATLRELYARTIGHYSSAVSWAAMERDLRGIARNNTAKDYLIVIANDSHYIREYHRNPISHPGHKPYNSWAFRRLLSRAVETLTLLSEALERAAGATNAS